MDVLKQVDIDGGLLIGHDGSDFSDAALAWTFALAERLKMPITVVRAWSVTTAPRPSSWKLSYMPPLSDFAGAVCDRLKSDTEALTARFPDVDVRFQAVHGSPARRLIEASEHADMLMVGPRGLGGFSGLVLGSVSENCVRHAKCPVVVVRGEGKLSETPAAARETDGELGLDAGLSDDA